MLGDELVECGLEIALLEALVAKRDKSVIGCWGARIRLRARRRGSTRHQVRSFGVDDVVARASTRRDVCWPVHRCKNEEQFPALELHRLSCSAWSRSRRWRTGRRCWRVEDQESHYATVTRIDASMRPQRTRRRRRRGATRSQRRKDGIEIQKNGNATYFFKPTLSASSTRSLLRWALSQLFVDVADMAVSENALQAGG